MLPRSTIEESLAELRRLRGAAKLDGKKFDDTQIEKAEAELEAIDDAEAEAVRRQREQAAKEAKAERQRKVKAAAKLEEDRLLAWADAEAAGRSMLQAIRRVMDTTTAARMLWSDLAQSVPSPLGPFETQHRIRGRFGELLFAAKAGFEVPGAGGIFSNAISEDWCEAERKAMASQLDTLSEEKN